MRAGGDPARFARFGLSVLDDGVFAGAGPLADRLALVEPSERGDPMSPLRWTCKSLRPPRRGTTRRRSLSVADLWVWSGRGPATHVFSCRGQQSRGWPACAGHDAGKMRRRLRRPDCSLTGTWATLTTRHPPASAGPWLGKDLAAVPRRPRHGGRRGRLAYRRISDTIPGCGEGWPRYRSAPQPSHRAQQDGASKQHQPTRRLRH